MSTRPETGPMKFGDDWTGVFIRGDHAMGYASALDVILGTTDLSGLAAAEMQGLLSTLRGCDERATHLSDTQMATLVKP